MLKTQKSAMPVSPKTRPSEASIEMIRRLVSFDTTTGNPNAPLIDFVESYLKTLSVESLRIWSPDATRANLIATIGPTGRPGYVLSAHTDVVPVDRTKWDSDPFDAQIRDGRIYGRGTTDMKGFCAVVLAKVAEMRAAPLARPIHLALSYDEEIGCVGVRGIIEEIGRWSVQPLACFVGEPTGMQVVIGHKGKRSVRVEVRGRAGHSSLAPMGINAIEFAARLIMRIREIGERLAASSHDEMYDVPFTTAQTGVISGGRQLNIVPDYCAFEFEFRNIGLDDGDTLVGEVEGYAREVLEPEMHRVAPEAGFDFFHKPGYDGLETAPDAEIVTLAKTLAGRNDHAKVAYGAEAGLYSRRGGIPSVLCGPGYIAQAHTANEFLSLDQVALCERFIDRLIAHACQ